MSKTKSAKPKKLSYLLIDRAGEDGWKAYELLDELVDEHHTELREARIALAWNLSWQPDVDGRCILGKCVKASDLDRELAPYDFVVLLRREFWQDPKVLSLQRRALLDHELMHATVKLDAAGDPVIDQKGRPVYRLRRHDLEEFSAIVERYGCWKKDIEAFATALDRARHAVGPNEFIGFQSLHDDLSRVGLTVPMDVIVEWSDPQRREAKEWAHMRRELKRLGGDTNSVAMPAHVAAAAARSPVPA